MFEKERQEIARIAKSNFHNIKQWRRDENFRLHPFSEKLYECKCFRLASSPVNLHQTENAKNV